MTRFDLTVNLLFNKVCVSIDDFLPSYCQILTDLDIVVRNTLVSRLRPRSACGRLWTVVY